MKPPRYVDVGEVYGEWTVIGQTQMITTGDKIKKRRAHAMCRCSCGTERMVRKDRLSSGRATNCGHASSAGIMAMMGVDDQASWDPWWRWCVNDDRRRGRFDSEGMPWE